VLILDPLEPNFLPEEQASSLTAPIRLAIAPEFQMDRVRKPPTAYGVNGITSLVCPFVNSKSLSTKFKHLRHKRKTLQATPFVEGPQDLIPASYFHPVSRPQFHNDLAMLDLTRLSTKNMPEAIFDTQLPWSMDDGRELRTPYYKVNRCV
jgi:hypothetical protein